MVQSITPLISTRSDRHRSRTPRCALLTRRPCRRRPFLGSVPLPRLHRSANSSCQARGRSVHRSSPIPGLRRPSSRTSSSRQPTPGPSILKNRHQSPLYSPAPARLFHTALNDIQDYADDVPVSICCVRIVPISLIDNFTARICFAGHSSSWPTSRTRHPVPVLYVFLFNGPFLFTNTFVTARA
jgi:hypothetical protein